MQDMIRTYQRKCHQKYRASNQRHLRKSFQYTSQTPPIKLQLSGQIPKLGIMKLSLLSLWITKVLTLLQALLRPVYEKWHQPN